MPKSSSLAPANDGQSFQAITLPLAGSTTVVLAGVPSMPLPGGLYRFHAAADTNVALVDPALNVLAGPTDLLLQAGVDEYFNVPDGGIISATSDVQVTKAP